MRNLLRSLRGFNADGRTLGLGLAVAMEKQRQEAAREVETFLREQPAEPVADRRVTV